jgi:hypothetical protein
MTRDLTLDQLAEALRVTKRTAARYVKKGCPSSEDGQWFSEAEARAWCAQEGLRLLPPLTPDTPRAPSAPATAARASGALDVKKADLARKLTLAQKAQREMAAERRLKDLGLDEKIRAVQTHDDLLTYTKEVMALVGSGELSATRGQTLRSLVAVAGRTLKAKRETEGGDEPERLYLASSQGIALLEAFEWIVSDERRSEILAHVRREREVDEEEHPNVDLAAHVTLDSEGDDPMPEDGTP